MAASPRKATSIDREPPATRRDTQIRPFSLGRLVILAILGVLIVWPLSNRDVSQISLLEEEDDAPKTALILTAHPDDEVMFFTPTILGLIAAGWQVSALCLCTGNGDGLGAVRSPELFKSYERLGVPSDRVTLLDDPYLQDGMRNHWSSSYVSKVLDRHLASHPVSIIITFDLTGITHHPNHIALAHGCSFGPSQTPRRCFALESPHLATKFTGPLFTVAHKIRAHAQSIMGSQPRRRKGIKRILTFTNDFSGWVSGARAMGEHWSQLVWFRYLYFSFSRLVWDNTLEELLEHG